MLVRLGTPGVPDQRRVPDPTRAPLPPSELPPPSPRTESKPRTHLYRQGVYWPDFTRGVCGAQQGRFERITQFIQDVDCPRCLTWARRQLGGRSLDRGNGMPGRSPC